MGQDLGEDAVLGRAEEGGLHARAARGSPSPGSLPAGLQQSTAVPSSMSTSSRTFIARITVRLLSRSARAPPGRLKRISGISRIDLGQRRPLLRCPWHWPPRPSPAARRSASRRCR